MGDTIALWVGVAVGLFGLVGAFLRNLARFQSIEAKAQENSDRIEKLEKKLDSDFNKLEGQITSLRAETNAGFANIQKTLTDILFKMSDR